MFHWFPAAYLNWGLSAQVSKRNIETMEEARGQPLPMDHLQQQGRFQVGIFQVGQITVQSLGEFAT